MLKLKEQHLEDIFANNHLVDRLMHWYLGLTKQRGMFQAHYGLAALAEPIDLDLYRSLLPDSFSMPGKPLVAIHIVHFSQVSPWPMTPYYEGSVALTCNYQGIKGMFIKSMPVSTWAAKSGGRIMGFPKYVADKMCLQKAGKGWLAQVIHKGSPRISLEYTPGMTQAITPEAEEILNDYFFLNTPAYLLVPPDLGPTIQITRNIHALDPVLKTELGQVQVALNSQEMGGNLIENNTQVPGVFGRFKGGINMTLEKITEKRRP